MSAITLSLLALPSLLMAAVLLPRFLVDRAGRGFRLAVTTLVATQLVAAIGLLGLWMSGSLEAPQTIVLYDGISGLMLALVSFVGWVICRYSQRYLDGESGQGRYYRWLAFTIGSVSVMSISGNLMLLVGSWVATGLGLHALLMHYGDRAAARRAAWTSFVVSRVSDVSLAAAAGLLCWKFGTLELSELLVSFQSTAATDSALGNLISGLLVLAAVTKSAQFPFHSWVPLTMETPTPVSALMHAGIINAGGFLLIRTSPLISVSPTAMTVLALIGGLTACYGAIVMLTQTSVKRSLAYSTIAQMGFMMLQCGLGAFSAAMLHVVAHSLYKAHAFLSSGSVLAQWRATQGASPRQLGVSWTAHGVVATLLVASLGFLMILFGVDPLQKQGGWLLGGILCLALTQFVVESMRTGDRSVMARTVAASIGLCLLYVLSFASVDAMVASSLPATGGPAAVWLVATAVFVGFAAMYGLHIRFRSRSAPAWLSRLYVHAGHGFYIDAIVRRWFGSLQSS